MDKGNSWVGLCVRPFASMEMQRQEGDQRFPTQKALQPTHACAMISGWGPNAKWHFRYVVASWAAAFFSEYSEQAFPIKLSSHVSPCCVWNRMQAPRHQVHGFGLNNCMGMNGTENVSVKLPTTEEIPQRQLTFDSKQRAARSACACMEHACVGPWVPRLRREPW